MNNTSSRANKVCEEKLQATEPKVQRHCCRSKSRRAGVARSDAGPRTEACRVHSPRKRGVHCSVLTSCTSLPRPRILKEGGTSAVAAWAGVPHKQTKATAAACMMGAKSRGGFDLGLSRGWVGGKKGYSRAPDTTVSGILIAFLSNFGPTGLYLSLCRP